MKCLLTLAVLFMAISAKADNRVVIRPDEGVGIATGNGAANSGTLRVALASDSAGIVTSTPTASVSTAAVTTVSVTILNANPNRKHIECLTIAKNTDSVFLSLSLTAATFTAHIELPPPASWEPSVVYTGAISAIAESGTQDTRCTEY